MPTTTKMADISATSMNTRTSLVKTAKARSLIFNLYICVLSIGRLFTTKPRILRLILNSRRVFKNQLYFMVKKSNFVAFFQDTFSLCGITPNHLRLRLCMISKNSLLSKDIKISLGLLITVQKMHVLFRKITTSVNNWILESSVEPKIRSKS